jgi:heme/copper-type cytochrome/quinol oxidase subunit 3
VAGLQGRLAQRDARRHGFARGHGGPFETMGPWPIPTLNTALLLTSGVTSRWPTTRCWPTGGAPASAGCG